MRTIISVALAVALATALASSALANSPQAADPLASSDLAGDTVVGLVVDIDTATGSDPRHLTPADGRLSFTADDGEHGRELWSLTRPQP